jgi:hypothetical protein
MNKYSFQYKVERAGEHFASLSDSVRSFFDTSPYTVACLDDPTNNHITFCVETAKDIPIQMSLLAGEVIHQLRSALDHLAFQLVLANGKTPNTHTYFPIASDASSYNGAKAKKTAGMSHIAINEIDALRPYQGGDDTLWLLHSLNNIEKHRELLLVGSSFRAVDVAPELQALLTQAFAQISDSPAPILPRIPLVPKDRLYPLKPGAVLYQKPRSIAEEASPEFLFEIAFGEPDSAEGRPLLPTLKEMIERVATITQALGAHLP